MNIINEETILKLSSLYTEDSEVLNIVYDSLKSFEEYHIAIYDMELWMRLYSYKSVDKKEYQSKVADMDRRRRMFHNSALSSVNILNRLALKENLPPVYEGIVSEEMTYRREVANAILEYVENIIKKRK